MTKLEEFLETKAGCWKPEEKACGDVSLLAFVKLVRERYSHLYHNGTDDIDFYVRPEWCYGKAFNEVVKELGLEKK